MSVKRYKHKFMTALLITQFIPDRAVDPRLFIAVAGTRAHKHWPVKTLVPMYHPHTEEHVNVRLCTEPLPGILFVLRLILGMQSHQTSLCFCVRGPPVSCCSCWLRYRTSVSSKQNDKLRKKETAERV